MVAARSAVPVHYTSWEHFTEDRDQVTTAFTTAGLGEALRRLVPGVPETLG
ncbi:MULTISPECIES: hypothetical protein [Streptomyces]|uniref:hypothetical protein n=1 Tax=Streptomyces TaxID=1883 RepID=UPI0018E002BB|nr:MULTISPECIES: hypothetical protein [Streptomyces]MCZ4102463.1 hypothetical protein [Streptomyces sp. H39-C1]